MERSSGPRQSKRDTPAPKSGDRTASQPKEGRDARLITWFELWCKPMRRWIASRSSVPPAEIDDLAQEVFLRLLRYSDDVVVENPQSYLFRIASNVASEWRERARNSRPHDECWLDDLQIEPCAEPENAVARTLIDERVRAAVDELPPRQRQVLLLHVNDGLTYKQIAEHLGLTYRIVLRDLTRAYSRLRMQLDLEDLRDLERV